MKLLILILSFYSTVALAVANHEIYDGNSNKKLPMEQMVDQIQAGDIVVVGEVHDRKMDHDHQVQLIQALVDRGFVVNVGMEFFSYIHQAFVKNYLSGVLTEEEFLNSIGWGGDNFQLYKEQMWQAKDSGGTVIALNMPRTVTKEISKKGLGSISPESQKLMPPDFELGNDLYKQRFLELLGGHGGHAFLENMFAAQSTWDDTMAWQATGFMSAHLTEVMVVIVGNFHVLYDGGLPDRIRARGYSAVKTVTHVDLEDVKKDSNILLPDPTYGILSDWVWLSSY